MKGVTDRPGQERRAGSISVCVSVLLNTIMSSDSHSHASLRQVNLDGGNVGASMIMRRNSTSVGERNEGCGVNIYITNNVQGVHNSVLIGSQVTMGDPGLWITVKDPKLDRGFSGRRIIDLVLGLGVMLGFAILVVYLVISMIWYIDG